MIETCEFADYKRHNYYDAINEYGVKNYETGFITLGEQIEMELNIIEELKKTFNVLYTTTPKDIKDYQTSVNFYNGENKEEMILKIEKNIINDIKHNFDNKNLLLIYDLIQIRHYSKEYQAFTITFRINSIPESLFVASNLNLL